MVVGWLVGVEGGWMRLEVFWTCLEVYGRSGRLSERLGASEVFGSVWKHLAASGGVWKRLEASGSVSKRLAAFSSMHTKRIHLTRFPFRC